MSVRDLICGFIPYTYQEISTLESDEYVLLRSSIFVGLLIIIIITTSIFISTTACIHTQSQSQYKSSSLQISKSHNSSKVIASAARCRVPFD
jgi:hypothetical protein